MSSTGQRFDRLGSAKAKYFVRKFRQIPGFAYYIAAIQECLNIGVYDTTKFPSEVFDFWANSLDIKDPIYDLRQSFFDPLGHPLYLHPFSETFITNVISGRTVVKMAINVEQ